MSDADKYLEKLKKIKRGRGPLKEIREAYRAGLRGDIGNAAQDVYAAHSYLSHGDKVNPLRALSRAYAILKKSDYPEVLLVAAEVYERLDKGRKAVPMLIEGIDRAQKKGETVPYEKVEAFIKRNAGGRKKKSQEQGQGGLEGRVGVFILFLLGGLVLSIFSLTATGNAISNLTGTTQGLLGVFLFIAGLVGMFFHFRRR